MKRSEMIEIIKERLYNLPQDKAYLWKYIDEEADAILSEIEEAGMLPPITTWNTANEVVMRSVWEPEDE